jgi:TonB-dependent receptor
MKFLSVLLHRLGSLALLAFLSVSTVSLQAQTSGSINGRVFNGATGQSLQGAIVRIIGTELRADSSRDGEYVLRNVPPGTYEIEASYFGLDAKRQEVRVVFSEATRIDFSLGSDTIQLEALRVEAAVLGQARAINQQRTAEAMVNITSEELFGEMPDNNIAKALQRIPGVSANSDGSSEIPRYVNIRGFDASLNSVQLNGARLPTTNDGTNAISGPARGFALDDLPASAITNIEIIKSPTPDMDGDAVGGIVNLVTKSALDRGGRSIDFNAGLDYIKLRDTFTPHLDLGYSDLLLGGKLGVSINVSYYEGDEGFDNIDYDWLPLAPGQPQNAGYGITDSSVFFHEDTEYNNYFIERERFGFSASLDYRLSATSRLFFRPVYTTEKRFEDDRRFHKIMDNDHGRAASAPPLGAAVGTYYTGTRGRAVVTSETTTTQTGSGAYSTYTSASRISGRTTLLPNGNGRGSAGYRQTLNDIEPEFYSMDFGGEHDLMWGNIKWSLFYSEATRAEIRDTVRFDRNGLQWQYDRPEMLRPTYVTVNGIDPYAVPVRGNVDYFINPSSSNMNRHLRDTTESVWQGKVDVAVPFFEGTGVKGTFKTGVKLRAMDREHNRSYFYYRLNSFATYDMASYLRESAYTVSDFEMPYHPDTARIIGEASGGSSLYVRDTGNARRAINFASDYEATEDSYEGYAMGVFDVGPKLKLISGVRVEHTVFEATTPVYDLVNTPLADRAPQTENRSTDYTEVLPGFHARYEARNNVVFRGAYTHTYARPSFRELIAVTTYDEANNVITTGNPDLSPYKSENWDLSVEYYGKKASYFQAALFYKKVEGQVLETGAELSGAGSFNGIPLNPAETYTVTTFSNQHNSTNYGVELVGRYRFITLPTPFDGFYLDGSVTYTDSNGNYADRPGEKLPTYGGSEWLFFGGLGYQKDRFAALLSYRYRSEYLEGLENVDRQNRSFGLASDVGDDWWGEEKYWNFETSYRVTKNYKVYCNVSNLAEFTNYSTQSPYDNNYPEDSYWHEMRISFGVKGSF